MFHEKVVVVSALIFAGLIGCAPAGSNHASGLVRGSVVTGPICPGPARRDKKDCAPRSLQTTIRFFAATARNHDTEEDKPLMTVATDRDGRFQVTLEPGVYRLVPVSPSSIFAGKPRDITVIAGSTTNVGLFVDTGMR